MRIIKASEMGFCWGVRRAITMMEQAADELGPLESLGDIVHNRQVMGRLGDLGVNAVKDLDGVRGDKVAITAHGVGEQVYQDIAARGLQVVDSTCPIVHRAQLAAKKLVDEGFTIFIFGDAEHREVKGVLGWAGKKAVATQEWPPLNYPGKLPRKIGLLSQTTQSPLRFAEFVNKVIARSLDDTVEIRVVNTTCDATTKQQQAVHDLASEVDVMIVVGGKHSANTRHLVEISQEQGVEAHHIESAAEVEPAWLYGHERVGVTAGASTPDSVVDEVVARLEAIDAERTSAVRR